MFGLFKKQGGELDGLKANMRREFDQTIAVARVAPLSKQARVGKGIIDALSEFDRRYTKRSFQGLEFKERKAFQDHLAKRQDELRLMGGDVSLEHIGYSLVARWVVAVSVEDDQLIKHFEDSISYFKRAAETL
ncbi:MAG TPA: hypothetical protein VHM92_08000 [Allosphingosinicella sp.]|nr:hypothetical protein [Allosphingosinicella sp.]